MEIDIRTDLSNRIRNLIDQAACPVLYEDFSLISPPYLTACGHRFSYRTFTNLKVYKAIYQTTQSYCWECPQCKFALTHATLDLGYLELVILSSDLLSGKRPLSDYRAISYFKGGFAITIAPKGSLLALAGELKIQKK